MTVGKGQLDADGSSEFRALLREARQQLLRTVVVTDDELASLSAHEPGALVEDSARGAMADVLERLEGRERHELDEIHAAQARLETGSFGVCEDCGGTIPLSRLRALPWARHCLGCKAKDERPRDVRS
jgi:DnaK suppressor protein